MNVVLKILLEAVKLLLIPTVYYAIKTAASARTAPWCQEIAKLGDLRDFSEVELSIARVARIHRSVFADGQDYVGSPDWYRLYFPYREPLSPDRLDDAIRAVGENLMRANQTFGDNDTAYLASDCPECGARVGSFCDSNGVYFHLERMKLVMDEFDRGSTNWFRQQDLPESGN